MVRISHQSYKLGASYIPDCWNFFFTGYLKSGKFTSRSEFSNSLEKKSLSGSPRLAPFAATINQSWGAAAPFTRGLHLAGSFGPHLSVLRNASVLSSMLATWPLGTFSKRNKRQSHQPTGGESADLKSRMVYIIIKESKRLARLRGTG